MEIKVLAFAQAADQLGFRERMIVCGETETPRQIIDRLTSSACPDTMRVALDEEYVSWDQPIGQARELALVPPVSGG